MISRWSRPIYGLNDNYQSMTREAREARDFELLPKAKKRRLKEAADGRSDQKKDEEKVEIKPGRKGFINRARVPMPSNQDYVVRPKVRIICLNINKLTIWTNNKCYNYNVIHSYYRPSHKKRNSIPAGFTSLL